MSATTIAIIAGAVLIGLAWLFLVAVLRSHAEILRRLHALEARLDPERSFALGADGPGSAPEVPEVPERLAAATHAPDIVGETLAGDAVKLAFGPRSPRTLLAFLSTGCSVCTALWDDLRAGSIAGPGADQTRIVVVTKGAERESLTRLGRVASGRGELIMSSDAWEAYGIAVTPHFVLVGAGERRILGRGGATSWTQIFSLLGDADSDARIDRVRSTSERAARAEQALAEAGIVPGHASLYPSQTQGDER